MVSLPGEPAPLEEIVKPLEFKNCWRFRISVLFCEGVRGCLMVKGGSGGRVVGDAEGADGDCGAGAVGADCVGCESVRRTGKRIGVFFLEGVGVGGVCVVAALPVDAVPVPIALIAETR